MKVRQSSFVKVIGISILAVSIVLFLKTSFEASEFTCDPICKNDVVLKCEGLSQGSAYCSGNLSRICGGAVSLEPLILYLEKQEKSPPLGYLMPCF
ncbi:MAG: hypothetical protein PHE61_07715 [Candidatus Omnitrophica bacterium]|nr:hypothetical protein [Candidatus Omnitrophota bacterium]